MAEPKSINNEIIVLPSWYPNKLDNFTGDFIQRHIKAISLFHSQFIIYVVKDEAAKITSDIAIETNVFENYTEKIIYYHVKRTGIRFLDKIISQIKYNRIYRNALNEYVKVNGCPGLIHVHVVFKAGLVALWAKRKWNIPFMLSEHWSVFLKEANYKVENLAGIQQLAIKKILRHALAITVVSDLLGKAILKNYLFVNYQVIPNVVDHSIFFPADNIKNEPIHFIHASSMNYEKNIEGILQAFGILKINKCDFVLNIFGPAPATINKHLQELGLNGMVFFKGEVTQPILAEAMRQSDALILFSRFETFGCVLIEANAAGIPVIVSDIPVFHELVTDNYNGVFAEEGNSQALAKKLMEFISDRNMYDKMQIANGTDKYSYYSVGKQFEEMYKTFLK